MGSRYLHTELTSDRNIFMSCKGEYDFFSLSYCVFNISGYKTANSR